MGSRLICFLKKARGPWALRIDFRTLMPVTVGMPLSQVPGHLDKNGYSQHDQDSRTPKTCK